ncbi:MAG: acyltransferase [Syntrophaceae bacterium]|nr:acyltransferase [Syntrophaceae bacterium]
MKDLIAVIRGKFFLLRCRLLKKNINIGKGLRLYKRLDVRGEGALIIGDNCIIGGIKGDRKQFVTLYTLHRDARIEIGNNAELYAARLSSRYLIKVGHDVHIEESGIMDTDFHSIERDRGAPLNENLDSCAVTIGDGVRIGARCLVTKGAKIGNKAVIGPGSVVTRTIPDSCFALGNPARVISTQQQVMTNSRS